MTPTHCTNCGNFHAEGETCVKIAMNRAMRRNVAKQQAKDPRTRKLIQNALRAR